MLHFLLREVKYMPSCFDLYLLFRHVAVQAWFQACINGNIWDIIIDWNKLVFQIKASFVGSWRLILLSGWLLLKTLVLVWCTCCLQFFILYQMINEFCHEFLHVLCHLKSCQTPVSLSVWLVSYQISSCAHYSLLGSLFPRIFLWDGTPAAQQSYFR